VEQIRTRLSSALNIEAVAITSNDSTSTIRRRLNALPLCLIGWRNSTPKQACKQRTDYPDVSTRLCGLTKKGLLNPDLVSALVFAINLYVQGIFIKAYIQNIRTAADLTILNIRLLSTSTQVNKG
jgi:hypothetical protein